MKRIASSTNWAKYPHLRQCSFAEMDGRDDAIVLEVSNSLAAEEFKSLWTLLAKNHLEALRK